MFDDFDEFWTAYPRKVGKGGARKAYAKAVKKGYWKCPCETCQEVITGDAPRKPCLYGNQFNAVTGEIVPALKEGSQK